MNRQDKLEFEAFCKNATDNQLHNIYAKEKSASRNDYADIAKVELQKRNIWGEM